MTSGKRLLSKVKPYAKFFAAISHPYRLAILQLIVKKEMRQRELVKRLNIPQNLVAHHLEILHQEGWILKKRRGAFMHFSKGKKALKKLQEFLM